MPWMCTDYLSSATFAGHMNLKNALSGPNSYSVMNASRGKTKCTNVYRQWVSCGGVVFKYNSWVDLLKDHYAKASLQEFEKLIEEIDQHLVNGVSGPHAKKGRPCYKRWLKQEAKNVN